MSQNRYCSFCWRSGHNRTTCSEYKEYIRNNPHSAAAIHEQKKKERKRTRSKTPRKCGFCRKPGHNAKTCYTKKEVYRNFATLNSVYRRTVLEEMCVMGLGVGALVNAYYRNEVTLALVNSIRWDSIHCGIGGSTYCIGLERIAEPPEMAAYSHIPPNRRKALGNRHLNPVLSRKMMGANYQNERAWKYFQENEAPGMEIVSGVGASLIIPPDDWLTGEMPEHNRVNPLYSDDGRSSKNIDDLSYEMWHFEYFAGVLGLKEVQRFFESFN